MKLRHIPFIILAVIILTLMTATFVEKSTDTDTVMRLFYGSWWFIALWASLVYAVGFHAKHLAWLRRPMGFHVYMVLAFLTILMTYFGVNFFLGGMHAYA